MSLAHHGVLILDELPEFRRNVLETLRQAREDGWIIVSRARQTVRYPARVMLVGAMNPCPCGYLDDPTRIGKHRSPPIGNTVLPFPRGTYRLIFMLRSAPARAPPIRASPDPEHVRLP